VEQGQQGGAVFAIGEQQQAVGGFEDLVERLDDCYRPYSPLSGGEVAQDQVIGGDFLIGVEQAVARR